MRKMLAAAAIMAVVAATPARAAVKAAATAAAPQPRVPSADLRAYMHGIGAALGNDGVTQVFFSSSGLPPRGAGPDRNWTHDVYVASWSPAQPKLGKPRVFIRRPEAQEPVSVAQNDAGNIMLSFEDGWNAPNSVSQRYGVYARSLKPVRAYPADVSSGGHSGHVAAVGERFVVFYSDDWIDGGGVDNLGTGNGVYLKTYDSNGAFLTSVDVAPRVREWWPMIAGSRSRALLVWQQYVEGETHARLKLAVFDPASGKLGEVRVIESNLRYYTYSAAYVPSIRRFLVVGSDAGGKGFAHLVDEDGATSASLACMPATVREAGITVIGDRAFTPSQDGRLLHLKLTESSLELVATQPSPVKWTYQGSLGLVRSPTRLHWVALSPEGLREAEFDLGAGRPASAADRCVQ